MYGQGHNRKCMGGGSPVPVPVPFLYLLFLSLSPFSHFPPASKWRGKVGSHIQLGDLWSNVSSPVGRTTFAATRHALSVVNAPKMRLRPSSGHKSVFFCILNPEIVSEGIKCRLEVYGHTNFSFFTFDVTAASKK